MNRMLRKRDGGHIHDKRDPVVRAGSAPDDSHQGIPIFFHPWVVVPSGSFRTILPGPRVKKELLEFRHSGTFNLNVRATPGQWCSVVFIPSGKLAGVNATDVDAARNGDLAVDNQHLAVIRMREEPVPASLQRIDRIEFDDLNSTVPQALKKAAGVVILPTLS